MSSSTRERMISAALASFRVRGLAGTSFTTVVSGAETARGVIYHHFPGGKAQLTREAVAAYGTELAMTFRAAAADLPQDASPRQVLDRLLARVRPLAIEAAAGLACPVGVVVSEGGGGDPHVLAEADGVLARWTDELSARFVGAGLSAQEARAVASLLVVVVEGATLVSRAAGTIESFEHAVRALQRLVPG